MRASEASQYLTFRVADGQYAIAIARVRGIIEYETVTRVPLTPDSVRGVINLRGSVVPVIDLAIRFGGAPTPVGRRTCIVIAESECDGTTTVMGVMADAVTEVVELDAAAIQPPPSFGLSAPHECVSGIARIGDEFVLLLDLDRTLGDAARTAPPDDCEAGDAPAGSAVQPA